MNPIWEFYRGLRRVARYIKYTPDRLLHPIRRRRAATRLAGLGPIGSALFVCYGNICRSPYGAHYFEKLLPESVADTFEITQAGFYGENRYSPGAAIEAAFIRGIDLSEHRSTLLSNEIVSATDLVIVMSREQEKGVIRDFGASPERVLILGDLDPHPIEMRTIMDPYARSAEVFQSSYSRIDHALDHLASVITFGPADRSAADRSAADIHAG